MGPPNDYQRQHLPLHLQNGYRGQSGVPLHARQAYGGYPSGSYAPQGRPQHQHQYKTHHQGHKRHRGHDGAPRLQELRQDNAKKARAHYQEIPDTPGVPRSVPRAPNNNDGILLAPGSTQLLPPGSHISEGALHAVTPSAVPGGEAQLWKNSYGNADKEMVQLAAAAGLDFLGSFYGAGDDDDLTGDEFEVGGGSDHDTDAAPAADGAAGGDVPPPTHDEEASYPASARRKLAAASATIAELEEENLTLREKIYLLETQLREAQQAALLQRMPSGHSGDVDSEAAAADDPATSSSS
ncbi:hypothetical protein HYH02_014935 [Chlamydomonas schloesseri]|uniref:PRLI-interacting factor A n=1 Tax=Chlamydomonas schloesseri TaxID=2026947 RepID=A0A835SU31_9CHLO|nr:hypothetical protein HYH02_014935 [Chlamydomonas schloesseri]|eukprot:KAG2425871.1 hypothetical protein HYH02_014935 [Chlamydomonas schloesseri]